jgi:hypothetical protein
MSDDKIIREFKQIGRYRIRLLHPRDNPKEIVLDIREYVNAPEQGLQGFTRRGVRLTSVQDMLVLGSTLVDEVCEEWMSRKRGREKEVES